MNDFFKRLFRIKGIWLILLGCAAGLLLLLFGGTWGEKSAEKTEGTDDYSAALEERCAGIINSIPGVSGAKVVITVADGGESVYARDESGYITSEREALQVKKISPTISGVAVVAKGAGEPANEQKIIELLSSLFAIPSNRIFVSG